MEALFVIIVIVYSLVRYAAKHPAKEAKSFAAKQQASAPKAKPAPKAKSVPISAVKTKKRAQMAQTEQWRAAKRQQDDAEQLHAIHIDSCESKLESLRVLHEAGILDNEEYAERVLRTKARHARGMDET